MEKPSKAFSIAGGIILSLYYWMYLAIFVCAWVLNGKPPILIAWFGLFGLLIFVLYGEGYIIVDYMRSKKAYENNKDGYKG
jgi:hypothetical protein